RDFKGLRWEDVPRDVLERNYCSLPFFTRVAFGYYCPAYLIYSLDPSNRDSTVRFNTLQTLFHHFSARQTRRMMTPAERQVIRAFLETVIRAENDGSDDVEDASDALRQIWGDSNGGPLRPLQWMAIVFLVLILLGMLSVIYSCLTAWWGVLPQHHAWFRSDASSQCS
ncbi:MAG TPA: DUF6714 family protein, partial [Pirellulales bacterium]|nr:DUF6714 family protein [Pirellulales bacterium]